MKLFLCSISRAFSFASMVRIVILICAFVILTHCSDNSSDGLPLVKSVDLSLIDPEMFTQEEWYVPYYLKHFSQVANGVLDTGANRGFIDIVVWRTPDVNKTYNARIMESILSLVWFYTTDRPWNPYYKDAAVRARIEAALNFWCNMQNDDGRFSEYAPQRWSLAPTAFATKFIGRALYLLEEGSGIDETVLERTRNAMQKALYISFTDSALWAHGRNFTNQYENLWGGALMYLKHNRDQTIDQLLTNRLDQSMTEFQSPCGYFYEKNGPDWGYNLSTHHSDLHVAWHYARSTRLRDYFIEKTSNWYDWFSYNAVLEPGTSRYYLNRAVETRQQKWYIDTDSLEDPSSARWNPQAEFIPIAQAFSLSKEEYEAACQLYYQKMREQYPNVRELSVGEFWAFSPYAFLHNDLYHWLPSDEQKREAVTSLPYLKNDRFTQVRRDKRNNTDYSFVRRPLYYAIFNSGKIITDQQRLGLGLVWHPAMGTVFQSQSRSVVGAWGTKPHGSEKVYETMDVVPSFVVNDKVWTGIPGVNDLEGRFTVSYILGTVGSKKIEFNDETIKVTVDHPGSFIEVIPLLVTEDVVIHVDGQTAILENDKGNVTIRAGKSKLFALLPEAISTRGGKPCRVIEIQASGRLEYEFSFR